MHVLLVILLLALNFAISWSNASYCGRYWTESKEIGGSFRTYIVVGYIMAIAGFTMVYGCILLMFLPSILTTAGVDQEIIAEVVQLSNDILYLLVVMAVIPTGFYIWIKSLKTAWEERTLASGLTAGWNTFAQINNTINVARNAPSAFSNVFEAFFGKKSGKKNGNTVIVLLAVFVVILAICSGYFTASAIMKKADREYDMFADLERRRALA